jgi:carbon storage regulator
MLVLTRKCEESIILAGNIEVKILNIRGDQVSLGFKAPHDISIYRKEVYEAIEEENRRAAFQGEDELKHMRSQLQDNLTPPSPPRQREGTEDS